MFPHVSEGILWIVLMRFLEFVFIILEKGLFKMGHNIGYFFPDWSKLYTYQLPGMYFCKQIQKKQISSEHAKTFISIGLSPFPGIVTTWIFDIFRFAFL